MAESRNNRDAQPWSLRRRQHELTALERTESLFALSNGHIGIRGTLEEGEPRALPGTYLNGFHEQHPLPYAETGYGDPEDGQTMVNATDGKIIRLLVEDEPFDVRYGETTSHERVLDFRTGTLARSTEWISPTGRRVLVRSQRIVSFTQRAVMALRYEVWPLDADMQLVVQSDLLANEPIAPQSNDPRVSVALDAPLVPEFADASEYHAVLNHHTRNSGLRMAAAMDHRIETPHGLRTDISAEADLARLSLAVDVPRGERLCVTKYVGYGWSARRSAPALRAQVDAALAGALQTGWEGLLEEQRDYLAEFWSAADIELHGDAELQQAVRFALFHVLQAGARGESRAIPGKGLTGPGYEGHAFWDTETFVLPVLTYTMPEAARYALRWRYSTLDKARGRARLLGQRGAAFPWRSIDGAECSAYWPAGTAAFHVSADVADAVSRYFAASGDSRFDAGYGTEILVETARLWHSLGHYDREGNYRIDGVTGPDEYTAVADNNAYTNLMAQRNLREAARACSRNPRVAGVLGVDAQEPEAWSEAADHMFVPFDEAIGVHQQSSEFTAHAEWDFDKTGESDYPLLLHYPYFDLYRKQVVKQADLVLAMYLRGDAFDARQKEHNFIYYEARTVRDSSLSAAPQAVLAAETGFLDLAYDYFAEVCLTDLNDLHGNVSQGVHIGSLAGAWTSVVAGFGGMRDHDGYLSFAPRLPSALERLTFRLRMRDSLVEVQITPDWATYRLLSGEPLELAHYGDPILVTPDEAVSKQVPPLPGSARPEPEQPSGRRPRRRNTRA
ncbi:glycoside hydrolase family 65 protein [Sciscionella marina]|uniref:glycoside hydrolase family 65 protein n=1 Tax=Sciscionella marina TaxID=508770 RepID=UPI000376DC9C|nr:glycosyl hydrolase family 65 protein [Sciscionella marina]